MSTLELVSLLADGQQGSILSLQTHLHSVASKSEGAAESFSCLVSAVSSSLIESF